MAITLFNFAICWAPVAYAKEGFSSASSLLPTNIQRAWDSTFFFILNESSSYDFGTAFLVKKTVSPKATVLYFLTDDHVVLSCKTKGFCANATLAQNALMVYQPDGVHLQSLTGLVFKRVEVVAVSKNPDLALLRVTLSSLQRALPPTLEISKSCKLNESEPLYTIGFSDAFDRTAPGHLPIENQNSIYKRCSQGIFTGYTMSDNNNNADTNYWAGTSVDVLGGGSGGPLLNESGQIVGAIKNGASNEKNEFRYDGNEIPGHLDWQSNAVRCEYLAAFVKQSLAN